MAPTGTVFTFEKATPYSIVYLLAGDGFSAEKTGLSMLSDLGANGAADTPIWQAIAKRCTGSPATGAANVLDRLNLNGADSGLVRIRLVAGINAPQTLPTNSVVTWTATGLAATLQDNTQLYLEIRLQHSGDR